MTRTLEMSALENVVEWQEIEDGFEHSLVLGNGASIALDPSFSYASLLARAQEAGLITPAVDDVFNYLETEDFELVLQMLWHAVHVNQALDINEERTQQAYEQVRSALVTSVRANHSDHASVVPHLGAAYTFLQRFDTVHSLNYDLVAYWTMMEGNDHLGNWFKDCFVGGAFHRNWERFRNPHRADGATLVFYPHGNLMLGVTLQRDDLKIQREDDWDDLLYRITAKWEEGEIVPLFVSEGGSRQKMRAIRRSSYLSEVYDVVLPESVESLVFYGFSFSQSDRHIVRQLARATPERVAVSVHRGDRSDADVEEDIERIRFRLKVMFRGADHVLFWASSEGAWIH